MTGQCATHCHRELRPQVVGIEGAVTTLEFLPAIVNSPEADKLLVCPALDAVMLAKWELLFPWWLLEVCVFCTVSTERLCSLKNTYSSAISYTRFDDARAVLYSQHRWWRFMSHTGWSKTRTFASACCMQRRASRSVQHACAVAPRILLFLSFCLFCLDRTKVS